MHRQPSTLVMGMAAVVGLAGVSAGVTATAAKRPQDQAAGVSTTTPIKHLVVIFQENVSFDHYFGTYPNAANTDGQKFTASPATPAVNGLPPATASSIPARLRSSSLVTSPET